jgi:hypothetical protein
MTEAFVLGGARNPFARYGSSLSHIPTVERGVSRALDLVSVMAIALPRSTIGRHQSAWKSDDLDYAGRYGRQNSRLKEAAGAS